MIITEGGPESGREVSAATTLQGSSIALFKGGEGGNGYSLTPESQSRAKKGRFRAER